MRIGVDVLLDSESLALLLEHHAQVNVKGWSIGSEGGVVGVLYKASRKLRIFSRNPLIPVGRVEVLQTEEAALTVNLSLPFPVFVKNPEGRYTGCLCNLVVIRTKSRGDMDHSGTVLSGHIVSEDYTECALVGTEERNQLVIFDPFQFRAFPGAFQHAVWHEFVSRLVIVERDVGSLRIEKVGDEGLRNDIYCRLT